MATTEEYINQLKIDKQNLVNNLSEKGIETNNNETFTSLVNKVIDIEPTLQGKTIIPTKSIQEVVADENYDGLSKVIVNSIPEQYIVPSGDLDIRENGDYDVTEYASVNVDIETGIIEKDIEWKDVVFIDFDGTPLYSYSLEEVQELTELPPLPTRKGFTYQGWNWTLSNIKKQKDGAIVGAHCVTEDGLTRIHLEIDEYTRSITFGICQNESNGFLIDWGDGTSELSGSKTGSTTAINKPHTYEKAGNYVITLISQSDTAKLYISGSSSPGSYLIKNPNTALNTWNFNAGYLTTIRQIEVGDRVESVGQYGLYYAKGLEYINIPINTEVGNAAFRDCSALKSIVIPDGMTTLSTYGFYKCCSLESISLPATFKTFANYLFGYCDGLKHVRVPNGVTATNALGTYCFAEGENLKRFKLLEGITSIPAYCFDYCHNLQTMDDIPSTVETIGTASFRGCYTLKKIVFKGAITSVGANAFYQNGGIELFDFRNCTSVPTLSATSAFTNISSTAKIVVPDELYDSWIIATNWSSYDARIVKESDYVA